MADDEDLEKKIPKLRETFADLFAGNLKSGVYDDRDIQRLQREDDHVRNYLRHQKGSVEKAAAMIDVSLRWRKEMELNDLTEESFQREIHELGGVYWHNEDNKGQKIIYFCIKKNKKDPEKTQLVKQFVAWKIDHHFLKNPNDRIVALMDMCDAGFGNLDIELIKFHITCFTTYFPAFLAYMLIYEMPWMLNAIWKVIKTLLSAEQQKAVIFVKGTEIQKYINKDQLMVHMGGTDTYEYRYIPSVDSGIEVANEDLATPTEEYEDSFMWSTELPTPNASLIQAQKKRVTFSEQDTSALAYTSFEADYDDEIKAKQSGEPMPMPMTLNIAEQQRNVEGNKYVGPLLTISPAEELEFDLSPENHDALDILSLSNNTDKHVAYKVKTTSPEKYRVRPSTGVVQPYASADIHVYLTTDHGSLAKDKFLIMYMVVDPEQTASQVNDLFKVTPRDEYEEHRLRCRLAPPKVTAEELPPSSDLEKLSQQMEALLASQKRLEDRLTRIQSISLMIILTLFCLGLAVVLSLWLEYLPVNQYTVNSCLPHYL